nr:VCBS repeat-containing protein [Myxococcota bacterium]
SWRYGGGVGYPDVVRADGPCTTVVRTRAELEAALAAAEPEHVVYVADEARIDLTGASLCIPAGVILASGRGREGSAGGLLHVTATESRAMLRACGDDVRVTGLRLHGGEPTECPPEWPDRCTGEDRTGGVNCRDCMPRSRGLAASGVDRVEVDNCELTGWTYGAVELRDSLDDHVHHSHIHHNQRQGLGYGVVLSNVTDPADVLVEHNRFDYNRHSVAGSGAVGHSYEARHNLVLPHANGHVFDMHGIDEATGDGTPWAGTEILVHDNTVLPTDRHALVVRGRPTEGSWLFSNCLARASATDAALQRFYTGSFSVDRSPAGAAPNTYGQSGADCETVRFCASPGGAGLWESLAASSYGLSSLGFADFDGDGRTDVFRADGTAWWWLSAGRGSWARLNTSSVPRAELAFADLDGDGRDDAFSTTGTEWRWSRSASGPWMTLASRSERLAALALGDFDGDGRADVFRADGTAWSYSPGGSGAWTRLKASTIPRASLGFGDFDGDRRTDVLRTSGGEWLYSPDGSGAETRLNASSSLLSSLALGDFDGDGRTDVMRPDGARWNVSWGARGSWQVLAVSSDALAELALGDFDGDGRTDVFRTGCL